MGKKKRIHIITHGCQMNMYDSVRMREMLAAEYAWVDDPEKADLVILNTCSVREKPEKKVLAELGRLRRWRKADSRRVLAVSGCVAQQMKATLIEKAPQVDLVMGPDNVKDLPALLSELAENRGLVAARFDPEGFRLKELEPLESFGSDGRVSAFVAVQKGCNHFCSYCIVPYVRGREKSRPLEEILREVARYGEHGVREVTLLGQNVDGYGADLAGGVDFADLLRRVAEIDAIRRIRFVTSHPAVMADRHIDAIAEVEKVCEYVHLPIQSGSDRVLERMRRGYDRARYLNRVARLRERVPGLAISGDMIVGFPGETEADFRETLSVVEEVRYDSLFSFIYSPRPGTRSARWEDDVPKQEKHERLQRLQELQKKFTRDSNEAERGSVQEVLFEHAAKKGAGDLSGRTRRNKIVNVPAGDEWLGRFAPVRIVAAHQNSLRGERVDES